MAESAQNGLTKLLDIIERLERSKAWFSLHPGVRERSILIASVTPGRSWEIEVFEDGRVEVEEFQSTGVRDEPDLERFLSIWEEE